MTIRDIVVAFGFEVDRSSEKQAEGSIKGLKGMATKLLGSIAVVFSVSKLAGFAKDCVAAASDVQEMENKFDVVFDNIRDEVDQWAEDFANAVGRNKNTIKTYLADQQNLLVGFGMTREEGAKLSEEMTSLALDIASFANQDEDVAVNAMTKAVMGESEAAKTLGAVLNDTTRAETMAAMGLNGTYQSLDQLTKMEVNYQTILRQSPDAIGDCVRSMDSYEARTRQLNSAIAEFKEFIGGQLLPVFSVFIGWITKGVKAATAFARAILQDEEGNNRLLKAFERIHALVKKLQPAMERFAQSIRNGISRATDVVKGIADRLGGMDNVLKILAIAAGAFALAISWSTLISGAKLFAKALLKIGKALGLSMPQLLLFVAVITIVALIVEDFIQFLLGNDSVIGSIFDNMGVGADNARQAIFDAFEKIKEFLLEVWDFLKTAAMMWIESIKSFFERHGESIRANFERAWGIIKTFLQGVWTFITQLAATLFGDTEEEIGGSAQGTKEKLLNVWQSILDTLSAVFDTIYEVASSVFNAVATVVETVFGWIQAFWSSWGSQILSWFKMVWDSLGRNVDNFLNIIKGVADFVSSVFAGDWAGAWEAVAQTFTSVWDNIVTSLSEQWGAVELLFSTGLSAVQSIWNTAWEAVKSFFSSTFESIATLISSILQKIKDSVTNRVKGVKDAIINGLNEAVNFIKALPSQAVQWGADFINGLKNGIMAGIQGIKDAVKGVADSIKSMLHFSVPDEGPLTDYESWMPDFIGGLAKGISDNKDVVLEKVKGLAVGIQTLMSAATANTAASTARITNNRTSNVTQNVSIANSYSGGSDEAKRNVAKGMKKSAVDATTQMAKALAYARG